MGLLSRFALRNPVVVVLLLLLVTGSGLYAALSIHQEALPDVSLPLVTITATYPGASAEVVLESVTKPLEAAVSGLSGIQALDSSSGAGVARLTAQFDVGSNSDALRRSVQDAVNTVALPSNVSRPLIALNGPASTPIMAYSLVGASVPQLTDVAQSTVIPALQALSGVASVEVVGGAATSVLVTPDPAKLKAHSISIATLDSAVAAGSAFQPVGSIALNGVVAPLQAGNAPASLAAIRALPVVPPTANLQAAFGRGASGDPTTLAGPYLLSARNALHRYEGPAAQNAIGGIVSGPTGVADADLAQALTDLKTHPADAMREAQAAERSLTALASKNNALYNDANFTDAVGWLQSANTALALVGSNSAPLTVGDLAAVRFGAPGVGSIVRINGRDGIVLRIRRTTGGDTRQVSQEVRSALATLALPSGVRAVKVADSADTIASSVGGATREGLIGALLAVVIIGLFLRNWRATVIAVVTIPVAFLLTLACLNILGLTLNVITLAGFAVATGRVVDDSIVVIENLYRRIAEGEAVTPPTVLAGVVDVGAAITSSTATTICVFLPLAFAAGLVSTFFAPFAWTVTIALISSYLAAVTVVPLLALTLLRGHVAALESQEGALTRGYRALLVWSLQHRAAVLVVAALTVLLAAGILRRTPTNLIPQTGAASATINITAPTGSAVSATGADAVPLERALASDSDIDTFYTYLGDATQNNAFGVSSGTGIAQSNQGRIAVTFRTGVDGSAATDRLRALLSGIHTAARVDVHKVGDANSALEIDVTGHSAAAITAATHRAEDAVRTVGSVDSINDTLTTARPQVQAQVDPSRAARLGLSPSTVVQQLQALLNGVTVAHSTVNGTTRNIVVALDTTTLGSTTALANIPLSSGSGGSITLGQVATLHRTSGVDLITRHNQQLAARIFGSITAANIGGVSSQISRHLKGLALPSATTVVLGGVSSQQSSAFSDIYSAMAIAVVLVFIVMVLAFRTLASPVAILFSLPVTAIGAAVGLVAGRQPLGLPALIGMLMLIGIVVTNAIVLMARVQQYRAAGLPLHTALLDAGTNRLRPIVMTAVATIGALLPLALGLSEGNLISQSLADTVIGGLISSTLLTLVVVPVAFSLLVRRSPPDQATSWEGSPASTQPVGLSASARRR